MDSSILISIKKLLGVDEYCDHFDSDIIMHINSVLSVLAQIGVGPSTGFIVTDNSQTWVDFLGDRKDIEMVKSYVFMRVKLIFDPPQNSATIESMKRVIDEFEWRANLSVDNPLDILARKED